MTSRLHADELSINVDLVRRLVTEQLPAWADLNLLPLDTSGSTNALFRLGKDLLVRMPRQLGGTKSIEKEMRWVPLLSEALPVRVPDVVALGEPGHGYPERWSVVRWLDGTHPEPATAGPQLAHNLADTVAALRDIPVPNEARADPALRWYRAEPLVAMDDNFRGYLADCRRLDGLDLDLAAAERLWDDALELPDESADTRWLHADLLAENLLVQGDLLTAVLDFGAMCVGDPTVDLTVAWEVLDAPSRKYFRQKLDIEDPEWQRGRAWALAIALMTFPYYWETMPERCANRLVMAHQVLADAA